MPLRSTSLAAAILLAGLLATPFVHAQTLPGGATSLSETHGDWTVTCTVPDAALRCAISQSRFSGENRQRVLTIELTLEANGQGLDGRLLLPFGLRLEDGVALQIDDAGSLGSLRFSTCLPSGCLAPLDFSDAVLEQLKGGTELRIGVTAQDTGQPVALIVSLAGLGSAHARLVQLSGG